MKAHRAAHSIATMCRVLDVSASGYYAWRTRARSARAQEDAHLTERIRMIHTRSRGTYGAPRIHAELAATGTRVGRKRVARLMRAAGLRGVSRRKRIVTTVRQADTRPAPDLVQRAFTATGPDQLWVADITYRRSRLNSDTSRRSAPACRCRSERRMRDERGDSTPFGARRSSRLGHPRRSTFRG